jgi:prolyl-tRNA synthetase
MRGVPLRMEVGPKDVENGTALARRDISGKEEIVRAADGHHRDSHPDAQRHPAQYAPAGHRIPRCEPAPRSQLRRVSEVVQDGWALLWHCGTRECEDQIKEETKASSRCFPLDLNDKESNEGQVCEVCGKPAQGLAYFGRAY